MRGETDLLFPISQKARNREMKLVVFAHTPPPMHGQSYMVKLMLDGLRAKAARIYHVDAKLSYSAEAIGKFKWSKVFLLVKYCLKAWSYRFAHGAQSFYYIPAPGKRNALYRDWIVLILCRPLFKRIIFHWHGVGLGEWIETEARTWERWITHRLFDHAALSIVLSDLGRADAERFLPCKIEVVPNGIPDPCPDFDERVLVERRQARELNPREQTRFVVLFAGACTEAKGLFVTLDAVALANREFKERRIPISVSLVVAGEFVSSSDRRRFDERIAQADVNGDGEPTGKSVNYFGFVTGRDKDALFWRCDCLCFPSLYSAEGQPVTIIEALAFGLPVVATRWRGIPELLTGADSRLIEQQDPVAIANALKELSGGDVAAINRKVFLSKYRLDVFIN